MTDSNQNTAGWIVFIAAIGMMLSLVAVDVAQLMEWQEGLKPIFVGTAMGHLGAVIAAYVGGRITPTDRTNQMTRKDDVKQGDDK